MEVEVVVKCPACGELFETTVEIEIEGKSWNDLD